MQLFSSFPSHVYHYIEYKYFLMLKEKKLSLNSTSNKIRITIGIESLFLISYFNIYNGLLYLKIRG